jgi:hypothetical protein
VYEADVRDVNKYRLKHLNMNRGDEDQVAVDHLPDEYDELKDNTKFDTLKSSSSCKVSDIKGIIYGGRSSRFWMLRKHINSLPRTCLKLLPF